jgi:hypothetical protein
MTKSIVTADTAAQQRFLSPLNVPLLMGLALIGVFAAMAIFAG